MDISSLRKRNASDGDSGFDSALSSRSSSICLEESPELNDFKISKVEESVPPGESGGSDLNKKFSDILHNNEVIYKDESTEGLYIILDRDTGRETQYKPPGRLRFDPGQPRVGETYSRTEYNRCVPVSRSHLFNSRLQLELEKQVAKMQLLEIDLLMDRTQVPPPSLGIRVIGVNMIHGVPDKLNIYVKKVMEDSVAGRDARIRVDDHIVEVNGVSLVGVSQKLAAETLSSCMVSPDTGVVHFVLARAPETPNGGSEPAVPVSGGEEVNKPVPEAIKPTKMEDLSALPNVDGLLTSEAADKQQQQGASSSPEAEFAPTVTSSPEVAASAKKAPSPPPETSVSSLLEDEGVILSSGALHSGTSEAFIPNTTSQHQQNRPPAASPQQQPPAAVRLCDLPASSLARVASHLTPGDAASLAAVNKSFYHAVRRRRFTPTNAAFDPASDTKQLATTTTITTTPATPPPTVAATTDDDDDPPEVFRSSKTDDADPPAVAVTADLRRKKAVGVDFEALSSATRSKGGAGHRHMLSTSVSSALKQQPPAVPCI